MTPLEVQAAATRALSALATLDDPPLTGVALAVCALADVGAPLPDDAPPLAQALARFLERGVIDAELGDGELEQLDGFAPATHAAALAEALLERGVEPFHRRLPRLLLPAHADLAFRFAAKTHEPPLLLETWLAALDAGVAWPAPLQARVDEALSRTDLDSRIAARHRPRLRSTPAPRLSRRRKRNRDALGWTSSSPRLPSHRKCLLGSQSAQVQTPSSSIPRSRPPGRSPVSTSCSSFSFRTNLKVAGDEPPLERRACARWGAINLAVSNDLWVE